MLRRVVSHPLFYLILLGACVMLVLSARSAKWGSWLGTRTTQKQIAPTIYQQKWTIDDSVIGVTMLHIELTTRSVSTDISFNQAVNTIERADALLANNVIAYLQKASNKQLALRTYTKNIDKVAMEWNQLLADLATDRDIFAQDYQQCSSEKTSADNQFFQWLNGGDGATMENALSESLRAGTCATQSRISMNAHQAIINRMQWYVTALVQLQNLLESNEDLIVANVDLFKDNYLEQLIQIRDQLGVYGRGALD